MKIKRLFASRPTQRDMKKTVVCQREVVTAVVVGPCGGGKSVLVDKLTRSQGRLDTGQSTVLQSCATHYDHQGLQVRVHIRDTSGQDDLDRLRRQSYLSANAVLLVFDTARREILQELETSWVPEIRRFCDDVPIILVGTSLGVQPDTDSVRTLLSEVASHPPWNSVHDVMRCSDVTRESDCDSGRHSPFEVESFRAVHSPSDSDCESLCSGDRGCEPDRHRRKSGKDSRQHCGAACLCDGAEGSSDRAAHKRRDYANSAVNNGQPGSCSCNHGNRCAEELHGNACNAHACARTLHGRECAESCHGSGAAWTSGCVGPDTSRAGCGSSADRNCVRGSCQGVCGGSTGCGVHGSRGDVRGAISTGVRSSEGGGCQACRGVEQGRVQDLHRAALTLGARRGSLKELFFRQASSPVPGRLADRRGSDAVLFRCSQPGGRAASARPLSVCSKCELPRGKTVLAHLIRKWDSLRLPSRFRPVSQEGDSGVDTDSESSHAPEGEKRRGSRSFLGRLLHRRGSSRRGSDVTPSTPELLSTEDLRPAHLRPVSEAEGHVVAAKIGAVTYFECSLSAHLDPDAILSVVVGQHFRVRKSKIGILHKLKRAMSA